MKQLITLAALFCILFGRSQTKEIDSLIINLAYQKQDSNKIKTSLNLIKALYLSKNYDKALLFIDRTQELSKTLHYTQGIAEANYYKACIYSDKDDYFNALDSYSLSKKLYQELNDTLGIAKVSNGIGLIEIKKGNYINGLKNSLAAIHVFEEKNLRNDLSLAYSNLAEAYNNINQTDKAIEFNFKSLTIKEQLNDSLGIKNTIKNIAQLYSKRKENRKAIEYYEKLLNLLNPNTDIILLGEILPKIGEEYLQYKDYKKASEYLTKGLKHNRRYNNKEELLSTLNAIGRLNLKLSKLELAEKQLNEAYNLALDSNNKKELLKNYSLKKELDSIQGQYQNAFFWQSKYYNLKEKLSQQESHNTFINTDSITDNPNYDDLNNPIINDTNNNNQELKKLKIISYALIAAFLTSLSILALIYLKRHHREQYLKELEVKNKQIEAKNKAISEQATKLEEINKVKDRLFSIISHDLKDSITSIKGLIDLLKNDNLSKKEFYQLVPELSENVDNASLLLFNLLNWAKSQMQNLVPNPNVINIQDIFKSKVKLLEHKIEKKQITLVDKSQQDFVYVDKCMIEIVIQNLLTNAVKFTDKGDIITISNKSKNGKALICIEDTGVGISKENLPKLFENNTFTTVGTKKEKGTGLGLSICKDLVEMNHGKIWVESSLNVGSKFCIELPKAPITT